MPVPATCTVTATEPPCSIWRGCTVALSVNWPTSPRT
ncbi:hypothetical protein SCE1572_38530 [Sorangium cellulosum So0157-2]|uniref:Uncharacterized protein n=1 Tax=Sorangium cellulosum So0157-2 TaxID=1254432 RepID=S4YAP7_SORCE|nr:hypothetical protein SCE1572_38530 [Sorangium cellulosum So0157-2]